MLKGIKNMAESIKRINEALSSGERSLTSGDGKDACPAVVREDVYQLDNDVARGGEPVKGKPEDFKTLYHRGTV